MSALQSRLIALVAVLLVAVAPLVLEPFTITLMNYIGVFALIALGLVLLTGVGGMVSFGQTAFMGIAAYSTAWMSAVLGHSPWLGLILALVLTTIVAAALGAITLRLQGHYLSISTVAWGIAIYFTFGNIDALGNNTGIASIPPISVGPVALTDSDQIYFLIWAVLLACMWLSHNMLDSRVGRAMRALRGGNSMVESLGIDAFRIRLAAFIIAALLAALSGWLYTHLGRFISPPEFDLTRGIDYLMMAMVGGAGYLLGAVVGSGLITLLKNAVQDYLPLIAPGSAGQLEMVVYSSIFIIFLQRARNGIVPFVAQWLPQTKHDTPVEAEPLKRRTQPDPGRKLLEVEAAQKRFGGLAAVNNVSFEVNSGEILGLIGPNGAGKSTMFNLVTGALPLTAGKIVFDGKDITKARQRRIAEAGVARTFQHVKLRPNMTLLDNVLLGTYTRTRSGFFAGSLLLDRAEEKRARHAAMQALKRVGLGDRPFELAGNLPLGNQRVLEIARALAADPVLLVLDEPAAGLRKQEKAALAELLKSLKSEHLTILLVEHDMEFVMGLVDRIVVMEFGTKLCEGDPKTVRNDERVQEAYLGGVA